MRKIIEFFVEKPIWANAIILVTLVFGSISIYTTDRSFFPELEPTIITITTAYPGASPLEMEEGVTIKVEEALKGISEIEELESTSSENTSVITVNAYQGTDMDELLAEVKNAVDGISSWPVGAEQPVVYKMKVSPMSGRAAYVQLIGPSDLFELKKIAEDIERDFLNSGEVSDIKIQGYPDVEYSIEIKEDQLLRYGLTFNDIVTAVSANNIDLSAGTIKAQQEELIIRSRSKETDAIKMEQIVVRSGENGEYITLGQVADVHFQFSDVPNASYLNGQRTVIFDVSRRYGEDLGDISHYLERYVAEFNERNQNAELLITYQFFDLLNQRIDLLLDNGIMGLALVLITLGLFLNVRLSAWVAFGIPFSFMGLFIIGQFYGMSINMISLFGMILVIGILVDDGIVIAENIFSHFEKGKSPQRAAIDGTMEVLPSVFTSILTTIIAFSVLLFVEGMERMAEMAFVVMASLGFSLIEAFFVLPSHLSSKKVLKTNVIGNLREKVNGIIVYMRDKIYKELLNLSIRYYRIAVILPLIFVVFVGYLLSSKVINNTFFPSIPFDDFTVEVVFQPGEREEYTEAFLRDCLDKVNEVKAELEEEYHHDLITYTSINVGTTRNLGESGSHAGSINIQLDLEGYDISSFQIANRVSAKIGEVREADKFMVGGINRWGKPVEIALQGNDYEELKEATNYLKQQLGNMSILKDVQDNSSTGKREILIELKPKAYMLGFNKNTISQQIRQGFYGQEAQRLIVGTDEARVWVRYPEEDRSKMGQLDNMRIKTAQGQEIPLHELVDYRIERGETAIKHFNGEREIVVDAELSDPYASAPAVIQEIQASIIPHLLSTYDGVNVTYRGQQKDANKSMSSMLLLLGVALFLMILVIALNFGSTVQAFIIFAVIPAGICGSILGHGIVGKPVSILSAWGMIALLGILVNDAVVFLDKYNRLLKEGYGVKEAIHEAGLARFRPIILTSMTTVAGLYPLILEKSFQAQFLVPMAVSVAYGVLFGTYFILVFFPALVLAFNDFKRATKWLITGKKPTRLEVEAVTLQQNHLEQLKESE